MTESFQIGIITSTHGLHGEVKVFPTTDDTGRFSSLKEVYADTGSRKLTLHVSGARYFKQFVILKFKEYSDINEVEFLKKAVLSVDRDNAIPLDSDEYYVADLMGMKVITDDDRTLGTVSDVIATGANDVYVVDGEGAQILIPAIKDCILDVDPAGGIMRVHLLEGLI